MRVLISLLVLLGSTSCIHTQEGPQRKTRGKVRLSGHCVPDQETAKKIVEATWIPIYGRQVIQAERPFKALLIGDSVWAVSGTVHASEGGAAYIEIRAKDCSVKKVTHYK